MAGRVNKHKKLSSHDVQFAPMEVQSVLLDEESELSVILLANAVNEEQIFPIVAGLHGGETIIHIIRKNCFPRPLTHDLLLNIIRALRSTVEKVVIDKDVNEDVVSTIHLSAHSGKIFIEAQASDALAIALASQAPIYARKRALVTLSEILERIQHLHDQRFLAWLNAFAG